MMRMAAMRGRRSHRLRSLSPANTLFFAQKQPLGAFNAACGYFHLNNLPPRPAALYGGEQPKACNPCALLEADAGIPLLYGEESLLAV